MARTWKADGAFFAFLGAVIDGLAIQETIGRRDYDSRRPYEAFSLMLEASLPALLASLPEGDDGTSQ